MTNDDFAADLAQLYSLGTTLLSGPQLPTLPDVSIYDQLTPPPAAPWPGFAPWPTLAQLWARQ